MVQFNLLPDVKQEYANARRAKRTVMTMSVLIGIVALGFTVLLFMIVYFVQRGHLKNLDSDIQRYTQELRSIEDLDKVLTVQNQLNRITELHDNKPVTTRLANYIAQVTPNAVTISTLEVNFDENTMKFDGSTDTLKTVNQFVDTLKFTDYQAGNDTTGRAFTNVVLAEFGRTDEGTNYSIELNFDPIIFSSAEQTKLVVPNTVTTRSVTEKPKPLFQPMPENEEGGEQ